MANSQTLDVLLTVLILLFIIFIVWSKIFGQKMLDTFIEFKEILKELVGGKE